MKQLPSSLREKQRYIGFKVHSKENIELGDVVNAIWDSGLEYLGARGLSETNLWIIGNKFNEETQEGVARVNQGREDDFRAALTVLDDIGGERAFIEVLEVSGSLSSLKQG